MLRTYLVFQESQNLQESHYLLVNQVSQALLGTLVQPQTRHQGIHLDQPNQDSLLHQAAHLPHQLLVVLLNQDLHEGQETLSRKEGMINFKATEKSRFRGRRCMRREGRAWRKGTSLESLRSYKQSKSGLS